MARGERQSNNEISAMAFGSNCVLVLRALRDARSSLTKEARAMFPAESYSIKEKALVGIGARLEWRIRPRPDAPESYGNQQTSRGCVVLVSDI
jgi:hypothetical protein